MKKMLSFNEFVRGRHSIKKEINGLKWEIYAIGEYHGETYHNRDLNLKLLDNIIDSENYRYEYSIEAGLDYYDFRYENNHLMIKNTTMEYGEVMKTEMSFEAACDLIHKRKKHG